MLREIELDEMLNDLINAEVDILILQNDTVYTPEEFFDGARILIDVEDDLPEEEEEDPEEELPFPEVLDEELDEDVPEVPARRGGRRSSKEEIIAAWDNGRRSFEEVMEITGKSRSTVLRHLSELIEKKEAEE